MKVLKTRTKFHLVSKTNVYNFCVILKFTPVNKIEKRNEVLPLRDDTIAFTRDLSYIASPLFSKVNFTHDLNVSDVKCV